MYFKIGVVDQYEPANTTILCTPSEDNSTTRKQCSSDQECRGNGRSFCDSNPECFGIAWYDKNPEQDLKVCLSFESTTNSGWHTMLKIGTHQESSCEIVFMILFISIEFDYRRNHSGIFAQTFVL